MFEHAAAKTLLPHCDKKSLRDKVAHLRGQSRSLELGYFHYLRTLYQSFGRPSLAIFPELDPGLLVDIFNLSPDTDLRLFDADIPLLELDQQRLSMLIGDYATSPESCRQKALILYAQECCAQFEKLDTAKLYQELPGVLGKYISVDELDGIQECLIDLQSRMLHHQVMAFKFDPHAATIVWPEHDMNVMRNLAHYSRDALKKNFCQVPLIRFSRRLLRLING